ncbi:HoxA-like transcriptional regulator [Halorubrum lipolyticum DSM 21995]|uniref:HoxA-like transcriptional regulator n=1 Tax=Halorubrum lipolyticum DSM 21995 TaxID=1227482 RepID=M0P0P1_9EURY|nr:HoxA-like transcriptional regulator [Halorubrum lipolyticum DSM 21995]
MADEYTVLTAHSGTEALEKVSPDVDVVLLDRRMPGLSGDDVLETIREREIDCRVVMVTAISPGTDILDLPFDDYLVKPVSRDDIRDAVSRMLVRASYDDTIQELVAIVSKMATLESMMTLSEMEASSRYTALTERFADLRAEIDVPGSDTELYSEFSTEKIDGVFG